MTSLVGKPWRVTDLARAMRDGALTASGLVETCLARIQDVDQEVRAWVIVTGEEALAAARELDREREAGRVRGPMHGIPFAVKDVIDVAGLPTRANSPSRATRAPATADATVVTQLRSAGAIVLGKVHTTEFAYFESVPPTRNPHDTTRTPGGSSAGSAAAVAAGMVPLALGTQTAGSVNRPAAYCGIGAFKPSTLAIGGAGTVPLAPSFDTVGAFGPTAADAALMAAAFASDHLGLARAAAHASVPQIVVLEDSLIDGLCTPSCKLALFNLAGKLSEAGLQVRAATSPVPFGSILAAHRTVLLAELGRHHARAPRDAIAPRLAQDIAAGLAIPDREHHEALRTLSHFRDTFWSSFAPEDLLLVPAAPDVAPVGMATGDPRLVIPATALGGPIAGLRCGPDPATSMPLGAMLMAAPGADARLAGFLLSPLGRSLDL